MSGYRELLEVAKKAVASAYQAVLNSDESELTPYRYSSQVPKEIKANVDRFVEQKILEHLRPLNIPILTEETGQISGDVCRELKFIVDPVDGTANFVRGLGSASISVALWKEDRPVFGVLADLFSGEFFWGGASLGAFCNERPITVSSIVEINQAVYCTGFPVRYQMTDECEAISVFQKYARFSKVRMLGSASISLLRVASGAAEVYEEREIMIWDVAAGLAVVEGAGGVFSMSAGKSTNSLHVTASNGVVSL